MGQDFLSDIELYYAGNTEIESGTLKLTGEEAKHCSQVMRNKVGDQIAITDGKGKIFISKIVRVEKNEVVSKVDSTKLYENKTNNIYFVIPRLKKTDRMEFALEKSTELGITNFIVYQADKSIAKGDKLNRWNKILLSAMKQSLRAYKPYLIYINNLAKLELQDEDMILFADQSSEEVLEDIQLSEKGNNYFIFGPEGGFSENEATLFKNCVKYRLTGNRLRSETAVTATAAQIGIKLGL